ncbi:hypothetical protein DVA86_33190 [Streptomyces armeniacus]|uniref:Uncharacterized protein n=1 Tax=Streptomyces armeniacus TaxID=83291 RepID=A0A345XYI0_9ACTN|nr:hypothetical protein [Streptomyces armeniacus]AXK36696.1 hypothetical protein DVA86_33190 [Streptomyces armeniacus]
MSTEPAEEPDGRGARIPRDPPDQQAGAAGETPDEELVPGGEEEDAELPDTDETGSGPRGTPQTEYEHPDRPEPYESTD